MACVTKLHTPESEWFYHSNCCYTT